ncbi:hypothetical protein E2F47_22290 [Mycobacterium eburneum]|nr:hypothetical protein [Mycobacterium eburneum]TDH48898.1 hypothetical protein E2F47_22290 [Mycobacterium eburneum]
MTQPWNVPGAWYPNPEGYPEGAMAYVGPVVWPNGIDVGTTKTAMMVFGPAGATGNFPVMSPGLPGLPPVLRNLTVNPVPYGTALPDPPGSFKVVSPGGPGIAAVYDMVIYINEGPAGAAGQSTNLTSAPDITGTLANGVTLLWNEAQGVFNYVAAQVTSLLTTGSFTSQSSSGQETVQLYTCGVSAQANNALLVPYGSVVMQGTANTAFEISANVGSTTGTQIGVGWGVGGTSQVSVPIFPSSVYTLPVGHTAEVYFTATQTANTLDAWSSVAANTNFGVQVIQLPTL